MHTIDTTLISIQYTVEVRELCGNDIAQLNVGIDRQIMFSIVMKYQNLF